MDLNALTMQIDREHDACGIYSQIEKSGVASAKTVQAGLQALKALRHRAGYVEGEGDGCGLLLDIPKLLWRRWLTEHGVDAALVDDERFFVAHLLLARKDAQSLRTKAENWLAEGGFSILADRVDATHRQVLGPLASQEDPVFLQIAGHAPVDADAAIYRMTVSLELMQGVHVASMSRSTVVYKVVGDSETLRDYYLDLQDPFFTSVFVLAHTRYSTNTATSFSRVQPFALLGHNGEINTISRFFSEAAMVGVELDANFSDSQMVDGMYHSLTGAKGFSLFEAAEILFPPIVNEIKHMSTELSDMYMFFRSLWGPFAQGPAGMMARFQSEAVFMVDALGLRPLWLVETSDSYCFSSEQGIVPIRDWVQDPKPFAPGEKIGLSIQPDGVKLYSYTDLQLEVHRRASGRYRFGGQGKNIRFTGPFLNRETAFHPLRDSKPVAIRAAAFGWREEDHKLLEFEAQTGSEPIRSLGYDGPLPVLDNSLRLVSDFLQETVAVVTNPAIDREREIEHFSTRTVLGRRPSFDGGRHLAPRLEIQAPLLLEELPKYMDITKEEMQTLAHRKGTLCYEDALAALHDTVYGTVEILIHREADESIESALARFGQEALEAVQAGANVIVLDDRLQFARGAHIDPFVATAAVHKALLRPSSSHGDEYLRRRSSIILRTGGIRNLHDVVTALGLGADAVAPYLMWEVAASKGSLQAIENLYSALTKGLEKVISTLGIHELRGYERLLSAIGLDRSVAELLGVPNFCGGDQVGYGFADMDQEAQERQRIHDVPDEKKVNRIRPFQLYPRIWKAAGQVAQGELSYEAYLERLQAFEADNPISLRHLLRVKGSAADDAQASSVADAAAVDTSVDGHAYPFVISSMSFGSQGEIPYRAYAEAAYRLNIVGLNGEGGEIKDLLSAYPRNRGRQVASGRFGVNAELCNGAYILEIKIGQGAKPGEGGHLPGSKVTAQVAAARNAAVGTDLISPSNNHDIYSIEDLAQVIYELRQVNPNAKIGVKVPVVPNIGTIAVGIVKAGADVVTLSGFDGGTGAARAHAIRHVGLPVELGIKLAHDALCESGLREYAEIWADGGIKSSADVMKAILLGANRVGFGTMSMVAIGCTSCRGCHKDTCHVGIATQMTDLEEAREKGVTTFVPRHLETAVANLTNFFTAVGEHVRVLTQQLGATRTQDLVGRRDLLEQFGRHGAVDLSWLLQSERQHAGKGTVIQFRDWSDEDTSAQDGHGSLAIASGTDVTMARRTPVRGLKVAPVEVRAAQMADGGLQAVPRALGTWESGEFVRNRDRAGNRSSHEYPHVAGNGFSAYHGVGMLSVAKGGGQDGVGKTSYGGRIVVLRQKCADGAWRGGSVGKGLAYGAQRGMFIVQGNADSRAGIRLSGADVIIGGEVDGTVRDDLSFIGARSNVKGFAFEYMTAGRALVLGDPGPWMCSGMTGGSVYVRFDPEVGLTEQALRRRIAKGAKVALRILDAEGVEDVTALLQAYIKELRRNGQQEAAEHVQSLLVNPVDHFMMIRPGVDITDQSIATE